MHRIRRALTVALISFSTLAAGVLVAAPAQAATRPVTLTTSSACVQYKWTITVAVTSISARNVDFYDDSDYGKRLISDVNGVPQQGVKLQAGVKYQFIYWPGASAQYTSIGVFTAGSGGWDRADPLASRTERDPYQLNPSATC